MLVLGRIVAPYGVRGWVHIHPFADDPASWAKPGSWWLAKNAESEGPAWQARQVRAARVHGSGLVAKLAEVDDRAAAEALCGLYVGMPREAMPATGEGEFYWDDLLGLRVLNEQGQALGTVDRLMETGAHAVLVVVEGKTERLLPFVADVVKQVDIAGATLRVAWDADW